MPPICHVALDLQMKDTTSLRAWIEAAADEHHFEPGRMHDYATRRQRHDCGRSTAAGTRLILDAGLAVRVGVADVGADMVTEFRYTQSSFDLMLRLQFRCRSFN